MRHLLQIPIGYLFSGLILLLACLSLWNIYRKKFSSRLHYGVFMTGSLTGAALLFFAAPWMMLSMYLRWLYLAVYLMAVLFSLRKWKSLPARARTHPVWLVSRVAVLGIAVFMLWLFISGYSYNAHEAVTVGFPMKQGNYYFMQAGSSRLSNLAHRNFSPRVYGYAMDIARLNAWGGRADGIHPARLDEYAIYGDTVYSPASGRIILVVNDIKENQPGAYNTRFVHGNHIILQAKGYRIFLAHFIPGTIRVKVGQTVKEGEPMGLVGNSGFSAEPHLHMNILKGYAIREWCREDSLAVLHHPSSINGLYDRYPYDGQSVPCLFKGKFYSLNDVIESD